MSFLVNSRQTNLQWFGRRFTLDLYEVFQTTNPVAVVTDLDDGLVLSQVPHHCFPTGVGWGQDVLNLPVPGHYTDVFSRLKEEMEAVTVKNKPAFWDNHSFMKTSVNLCSPSHAPTWDFAPGVIGLPKLFRSQMYISESFAPDASRLLWMRKKFRKIDNIQHSTRKENINLLSRHRRFRSQTFTWKGLKSRARTGPVCLSDCPTTVSGPELIISSGLYMVNAPFSLPPTTLPPVPSAPIPKFTHTMLCNL